MNNTFQKYDIVRIAKQYQHVFSSCAQNQFAIVIYDHVENCNYFSLYWQDGLYSPFMYKEYFAVISRIDCELS